MSVPERDPLDVYQPTHRGDAMGAIADQTRAAMRQLGYHNYDPTHRSP